MTLRFALAIFLPFLALGVQWLCWQWINPFVWFWFFPAVFCSARLAGLWAGLISTVLSICLVWLFFISPQLNDTSSLWPWLFSVGLFLLMGYLFSNTHQRLHRAIQIGLSPTPEPGTSPEMQDGNRLQVNQKLREIIGQTQGELQGKIFQDLTDPALVEQQVHKLSRAVEQSPASIVITNLQAEFEYVNEAFLYNTGYSREEVIGKPISMLKSGLTPVENYAELRQKLKQGQTWRGEFINRRKDGSIYHDFAIITPNRDQNGLITHYVAVQEDVSRLKKHSDELDKYRHHLEELVYLRTAELEKAKAHADAGNAAKSTFLANMSHEIRTPLNAVLGLCYLLDQRPLDEDAHLLIKKINGASQSLLAIINDILDFSKIEAGRLEIEVLPFRLSEMLDQLADLMAASALHKNLELLITPPLDADALIGDGPRLKQVLINLLSNAIKFTEAGEVELRINIESAQDNELKLRFVVRDTGIGIPTEQQADLFLAFTQADNSISRRFGGTGLGLTISKQLVKLLGGELQLKSTVGEGSEFWFVLPLQRDQLSEIIPSGMQNLHLLVIDDRNNAREALKQTALSLGWTADTLDSGQAAILQIMNSVDSQIPYDLFLIDWNMPGLDGVATAQLIRKLIPAPEGEPSLKPIILMVSAYSLRDLQTQSTSKQIDGLLSKPVTPSSLYNAVSRVLLRREQSRVSLLAPVLAARLPRILGVRVLVVDDSDINREVAQSILEDDGAIVNIAQDGQEALEWLTAHADEVDLVLMDIQMPKMDGYETTRRIRQNPQLATLPVLALTAGAYKSLQDEALAAGMNDFIVKPFNVEKMMKMIQHWTQPQPEAQTDTPIPST